MCGILGYINFNSLDFVPPSLCLLKHRGPDGSGEWTNSQGNVYFGHVRLAIIDPTPTGQQPMNDSLKRLTITFNGEIYNHLELRSLLPNINWRGNSDTETLIELLAVKGLQALPLLKGMFAFALHDSLDNSILLVRDRLGIKPLWLRTDDKAFCFASEVRPLIQNGKFIPTNYGMSEYLGYGRLPSIGEVFDGVEAIPPGSWMKIREYGIIEKDYWWPSKIHSSSKSKSRKDIVKQVRQLVTSAIEEHLISDVGMGSFLSGGIDSSIVALVAGNALGRNLQTFTVGFPQSNKDLDERLLARKMAKKIGSAHNELKVSEDSCLEWVKEAVLKLDLPSVDAINTYIVSKAVRDTGLKVALSGLGGDELFGGYPSFRDIPLMTWLGNIPSSISRKIVKMMPRSLKEKFDGLESFTASDLTIARRRFISSKNLISMGFSDGIPIIQPFPTGLDTMGVISWAEIQEYMIPMLLRDSDQMSMAVGLELRVPFLDHCLVEEMLSIPQKYKKGRGVKPLLVEAFKADLLPEIYNRSKQGFELPMDKWIRGPLSDFTNEGLIAVSDLLNLNEPLRQRDNFNNGSVHWTRIWEWSVLGHWLATQKALTNSKSKILEKELMINNGKF